jgi:uncharacterized protein YmfQ (DUF2313 family)
MAIMQKVIKGLFPPSWNLTRDLKAVIEALSLSFERIRIFFSGVITESNPGTAIITLEDWFSQEGIIYDDSLSVARLQKLANQAYSTTGGQSRGYLNDQLQIAFPDVELQEVSISNEFMAGFGMAGLMMASDYPSWIVSPPTGGEYPNFYFRVIGTVDYVSDLTRISNLLSRIMPVPYEPVFAVTILNLTPSAMAGLGMAGLMMAGREN